MDAGPFPHDAAPDIPAKVASKSRPVPPLINPRLLIPLANLVYRTATALALSAPSEGMHARSQTQAKPERTYHSREAEGSMHTRRQYGQGRSKTMGDSLSILARLTTYT